MHLKQSLKSFFLFILCITFLNSCQTDDERLGTFKISKFTIEANLVKNQDDSLQVQIFKNRCKNFFEEAYLKFYEKDTLTMLSQVGEFALGSWDSKSKNTASLNLEGFAKVKFNVEEQKNEKGEVDFLKLTGNANDKYSVILLIKKDNYYESENSDLMSFENNWWRIKPAAHESKAKIKARVLGQIDFNVAYFQLIEDNNYRSFMVSHLKSPFKFYSNGIGFETLPMERNATIFYDETDAKTGYEYYLNGMKSISKYPADPKSYTQGYINALKEIRRFVELDV